MFKKEADILGLGSPQQSGAKENQKTWQTAEKLGVKDTLKKASDRVVADFTRGVKQADDTIRQQSIDTAKIDAPKFYESMIKRSLAESLDDETPWVAAQKDMHTALQGTSKLYQSAPLTDYIKMRDVSKSQKNLLSDNFQTNLKGVSARTTNIDSKRQRPLQMSIRSNASDRANMLFLHPKTEKQRQINIDSTIDIFKSSGNKELISKVQDELLRSGVAEVSDTKLRRNGLWDEATDKAAREYLTQHTQQKQIVRRAKKVYNTTNKTAEAQMTPPDVLIRKMSPYKGTYFSEDQSSDAVYWAQKALNRLGYADEKNTQLITDARYTKATRHAVSQFQRNTGYRPTGMLDAKTLSALNAPFRYNGRNHLVGVFGETLYQDDVVPIAERMLSAMPPDTQVEIPYTVSENKKDTDEKDYHVYGLGINGEAFAGAGIEMSVQLVFDDKGNIGILLAPKMLGKTGFGAGINASLSWYDAEDIHDLEGASYEIGGSVAGIGYDKIYADNYQGHSVSIGTPDLIPVEGHGNYSYSKLIVIADSNLLLLQYYAENNIDYRYDDEIKQIIENFGN